ncbi:MULTISPECIES: hypothetical protein [unclassified Bradyrhizobium]
MNGLIKLVRAKHSFARDERGAVALEMPFVYAFLLLIVMLPLADVAIAGFQFVSAWEALRGFGQSILYNPPPDVTNASSWTSSAVAKSDPNYPVSTINLMCGTAACSSGNTVSPKYYSYSTSITLSPIILGAILCPTSCTYTLTYSERFQ